MNSTMEQRKDRNTKFKILIVWMAIVLFGSFWLTVKGASDPVSLAIIPQVPREGEPVMAIFKLNNQSSDAPVTSYQFYANGELLKEGTTTIAPGFGKTYKYVCENPLLLGEQLTFVVRSQSEGGDYEKSVSSPLYPPQVWSSFVSFASFSTSVMSSMSTMTYYQSSFGSDVGLNAGLLYTVVLIVLLIFLELTQPLVLEKSIATLGRLRLRFNTVIWILFVIFMGIVYTKVVMIFAS